MLAASAAFAQTSATSTNQESESNEIIPIYRITVVGRTVKAISYRSLSGSTKIAFRGTSLMPKSSGKAEITSKLSATRVQAEFKNMESPTAFGPEYLTYVLWAITPDGHPTNVAEIVPEDGKAKLDVTVNLQAFGLIVTAEPYFAVRMPSDVVVMENQVTKDTVGKIEEINAKLQLLRRGQYIQNVNPGEVRPIAMSPKTPLALYEAENAVNIAAYAKADQYAKDTYRKAEQLLKQAQDYQARKAGKKPVIMTAREAVQTAEDARTIAIRREQVEHRKQVQQAAAERAEQAKAEAQQAAAEKAKADAARSSAEAARERARAEAEKQQLAAQQAQANAAAARQRAQQAENQRVQMRNRLLNQLNSLLQTRQTSNGLVVTMSHVFFNTGKSDLHQETRVTLAKMAGILLSYPGLKLQVEGYTDNTGSQETNDKLSQARADAVRDFLVQQGLPADAISARGMGESNPVAPNDTSTGRSLNRRVEIVISGTPIGIPTRASNSSPVAGQQ